jgi:hypothetical protein
MMETEDLTALSTAELDGCIKEGRDLSRRQLLALDREAARRRMEIAEGLRCWCCGRLHDETATDAQIDMANCYATAANIPQKGDSDS